LEIDLHAPVTAQEYRLGDENDSDMTKRFQVLDHEIDSTLSARHYMDQCREGSQPFVHDECAAMEHEESAHWITEDGDGVADSESDSDSDSDTDS
jgi:hypothetical protein